MVLVPVLVVQVLPVPVLVVQVSVLVFLPLSGLGPVSVTTGTMVVPSHPTE